MKQIDNVNFHLTMTKRFISITIKYTCLCGSTITAHRYIPGGNQPIVCVKCGKTLRLVERRKSEYRKSSNQL